MSTHTVPKHLHSSLSFLPGNEKATDAESQSWVFSEGKKNEHLYAELAFKYRNERCMKKYSILVSAITNTAVIKSVTKENILDQISEDN